MQQPPPYKRHQQTQYRCNTTATTYRNTITTHLQILKAPLFQCSSRRHINDISKWNTPFKLRVQCFYFGKNSPQPPRLMSYVTHVNESLKTYAWVMAQIYRNSKCILSPLEKAFPQPSRPMSHVTHMNMTSHTYAWVHASWHTYKWVMSQICLNSKSTFSTSEKAFPSPRAWWVIYHLWTSHVTRIHESMSHSTPMDESCHKYIGILRAFS